MNFFQKSSFGSQPISVKNTIVEDIQAEEYQTNEKPKKSPKNKILANDDISDNIMLSETKRTKTISLKNLKSYINQNEKEIQKYTTDIIYSYNVDIQVYDKNNDQLVKINPNENTDSVDAGALTSLLSTSIIKNAFIELRNKEQYQILSGHMPQNKNELVLVVDENNQIDLSTMYSLNIENKNDVSNILNNQIKLSDVTYDYDKIIGKTYKLINATDYYQKSGNAWINNENDNNYLNKLADAAEELQIVGIVKVKDKNSLNGFLGYSHELIEYYINNANNSEIVKEQTNNQDINVFTGASFDNINATYDDNMKILGAANLDEPSKIDFYPKTAASKDKIKEFLDNYNSKNKEDPIKYEDDIESLTGALSTIVNLVSIIMIAFISISLIVSSLMIGIITYISVLERTKEIGILRSIGASKKDVKRLFRAETIIEGLFAGVLGIVVTYLLTIGANAIIKSSADMDNLLSLSFTHAIILILVSVGLTVFAGLAPASKASKKEPVESLKAE